MNISLIRLRFSVAAALLFLTVQRPCLAGSATWSSNPTSGDWNTAANWTPQMVPNSETDVATFGASNITNVTNADEIIMLDSIIFSPGASPYTINALDNIEFHGAGIVNNSEKIESFVVGAMFFYNTSAAGDMVSFTTVDGNFFFSDASSAGSGTFDLTDRNLQAHMFFLDSSTAGDATINASAGADIDFLDSATGGHATLNLTSSAFADFTGNKAEHMNGNCIGGSGPFSSQIDFGGASDAGDGTFTTVGGSTSGEVGGFILLDGIATANTATFIINGGMGAGLSATQLFVMDNATAANAKITANGGVGGSDGGAVVFTKKSKGGKASITLNGNAVLDLTLHNTPGVTIGSLTGAGSVLLGANTLTIGSNNASTTFSGAIQGGGGVTKTGTGTLTLSGTSTYTGATTISAGALIVSNTIGSATGTGSVAVNGGTLGGGGTIAGAVTVGTGSNSGAVLQPGYGTNKKIALTIQGLLTFHSDSTYSFSLKSKKAEVVANGVTIESGAQFVLTAPKRKLKAGIKATVISNTSSNPISGTFANLPDGATITSGGNTYQANYEGGDGNDLTLTVQ